MTTLARQLWQRLETLHAVTYFAPESRDGAKGLGLKGFWMGYFGFRAAPLGAVSPGVVEACFANFAPVMIERSVPDVWALARPEALIEARAVAAAGALRRVDPTIEESAGELVRVLRPVAEAGSSLGRPLYGANASVPAFADPVADCWQLATTLREHRGDGHVQLLSTSGLDGPQALQLHAASTGTPPSLLQDNRGWGEDAWSLAAERLASRSLVLDGSITPEGRKLHERIEADTDRLAFEPYRVLSEESQRDLLRSLDPHADVVVRSGEIPFPNPMGLPPLGTDD